MAEKGIPSRVAIPMSAPKPPDEAHIGTCFLGRRAGRLGLYTAAHVPVGKQPRATHGWSGWPTAVHAWQTPTTPREVQMFAMTIPITPLFSYRLNPYPALSSTLLPPSMADLMTFRATQHAAVIQALAEVFDEVDLDDEVMPEAGAPLIGFGYPDLGGDAKWPYPDASTVMGEFLRAEGGLIRARMPLDDGFSGGPVFSEDRGAFVGMMIGTDGSKGTPGADHARIVRPAELAQL